MLEVLDSRLLSVLAWYHLSFLAVSVAMLGMAGGAVLVFLARERLDARALPASAATFAIALAASHLINLLIPFPPVRAVQWLDILTLATATAVLAVPFVVSGVVVTLALTRTGASIGFLYGADLVGAAAGCLGIIVLLNLTDLTSAALLSAALAGVGGWCFARAAGRRAPTTLLIAAVLCAAALVNSHSTHRLGVIYPKNRSLWPLLHTVEHAVWNSHSFVMVRRPEPSRAWMWGPGTRAPETPATVAWSMIDGEAGTPFTKWDGDVRSIGWTAYDVTSLPYRLRHGRVGIVGVGGGRDVLTALEAGNSSITGIEINRTFIDLLNGPYREFAGMAGRPGVTLVHDEARSYLTRTSERFDILQMSLIDTWAATGAGAFTLTENGLYTREGWRVFLRALAPGGVLSVSRWYAPGAISETRRLVSLGVASLLDRGVRDPSRHLILASAGHVATLIVSAAPFGDADRIAIDEAVSRYGFSLEISPWTQGDGGRAREAPSLQFDVLVHARTLDQVNRAVDDPNFDFTPPTDARPFFFNLLKPQASLRHVDVPESGVIAGNLIATSTLWALLGITIALVGAIIVGPLVAAGRQSPTPGRITAPAVWYFASIGAGFMFIQIALLQRFSVYLGHPTYTFSIVLFLMILSAGGGSVISEVVGVGRMPPSSWWPLGLAAAIVIDVLCLQPATDATIAWDLFGRTVTVAAFIVPLGFGLGFCFPIGMRLVAPRASALTPWLWGVNGACGVLASVIAVMVSLWWGIEANLYLAAGLYGFLVIPLRLLAARRRLE